MMREWWSEQEHFILAVSTCFFFWRLVGVLFCFCCWCLIFLCVVCSHTEKFPSFPMIQTLQETQQKNATDKAKSQNKISNYPITYFEYIQWIDLVDTSVRVMCARSFFLYFFFLSYPHFVCQQSFIFRKVWTKNDKLCSIMEFGLCINLQNKAIHKRTHTILWN